MADRVVPLFQNNSALNLLSLEDHFLEKWLMTYFPLMTTHPIASMLKLSWHNQEVGSWPPWLFCYPGSLAIDYPYRVGHLTQARPIGVQPWSFSNWSMAKNFLLLLSESRGCEIWRCGVPYLIEEANLQRKKQTKNSPQLERWEGESTCIWVFSSICPSDHSVCLKA